jgi:hypothetical protein
VPKNGEKCDLGSNLACLEWDRKTPHPKIHSRDGKLLFAGKKRLKGFEPSTFCMAMAKVTREPRPLIMPICGGFAIPGERAPDGK